MASEAAAVAVAASEAASVAAALASAAASEAVAAASEAVAAALSAGLLQATTDRAATAAPATMILRRVAEVIWGSPWRFRALFHTSGLLLSGLKTGSKPAAKERR